MFLILMIELLFGREKSLDMASPLQNYTFFVQLCIDYLLKRCYHIKK